MSAITAQVHIDTSTSSSKALPTTPIPLTNPTSNTLTPSTELRIPLAPSANNKPQQLSDLADAMDTTRASLNQVLTAWKDWAGKEDASRTNEEEDGEEDEDEEE
ncbi:hypothetical protein PSEUBRA_003937 [Kalmanozyma brasiliensis GHG001]|uniref:Uncharacterized protein n=1 Tax=Kalmanozyma brasiliensis (strain GHG001) TaxID=1365824 RepID=V5EV87_KALBG|nr:uncharacterized protein PSEUBRA_003937 [Kalmanozyma brasiliensis GHG001]EST06079.1 hypothetical protein PSEUBRA_003937 [Kalmanozyma brasiliensis GHG001]